MELKKHQEAAVKKAVEKYKKNSLVYIYGPPRIGKSLIALETVRQCPLKNPRKTLVIAPKNTHPSWKEYLVEYDFELTNREKADSLDASKYGHIIIDEAHNFKCSNYLKPGSHYKAVKALCKGKPIVFLSGTPAVESPNDVYRQYALSSWCPFDRFNTPDYTGFRAYFNEFGIPAEEYMPWAGKVVKIYKKAQTEKLNKFLEPYIVSLTYEDAGFEYRNYDDVRYIRSGETEFLTECAKRLQYLGNINDFEVKDYPSGKSWYEIVGDPIPLDSLSKENQALHRLCGGFYDGYPGLPKAKLMWLVEYVESVNPGEKIVVMAYFIEEQQNLTQMFKSSPNVTVLSSTKYCEGVDLSNYDHFILYSFGYSGTKFIQLRDRIVNLNKDKETYVIIPLLIDCLDSEVYATVKNKQNFNDSQLKDFLQRRSGKKFESFVRGLKKKSKNN